MGAPPGIEPRLDHATLLAAAAAAPSRERREACKRIAAQVYRVVAAVLGPASADVGDASQDAFMRVYHAIPTFVLDPLKPHGPTAWVHRIALRSALDRLKERRRSKDDEHDLDQLDLRDDSDLDASIDNKELVAALLGRLNEKERAVLVLKYWTGETDEEIAVTLGVPLGTVKTRLRAGATKLRQGAALREGRPFLVAEVKA